ncbi:MAG: gamma-glutamyl-gamma-aminobutyrate hydrolase family protein [Kosmotogaceae bacterium]|nr:gamma-glutamyl-gamma-aminobutyrate hydrolase family protein [Kosmotogaceae bacterium]
MICILQNDSDFDKEISPVEKALDNTGYEYSTWKTFLDGFPKDELSCDGLVITGGFSMSDYFKGRALSSGGTFVSRFGGPILGICLGMQILARISGESLVISRELGVSQIRLDASHELFLGIESEVTTYQRHNYGLPYVPYGYRQIAWGNETFIQGIASTDGLRFGIQFHPEEIELGSEEQLRRIFANYCRIVSFHKQ